jgi:cell division protein ZapA
MLSTGSGGSSKEADEVGQVGVTVNGRPFKLACDDGQEPRLRRLAQYVDQRIAEFVKKVGQAGEARLLLFAALAIADELSDANEALAQERSRARAAETEAEAATEAAASGVHAVAQRIEALAARLERS